MKSIFKIALLLTISFTFYACPSDDEGTSYEVRDRATVYEENKIEIEEYLKSNYMTIGANNEVTVTEIPEGGTQTSIWDQYKSPDFGNEVPFITVKNDTRATYLTDGRINDDVDYKLHYIVLAEGNGTTPKSVDSTFVAYKGWNLKNVVFDQNNTGTWFSFPDTNTSISGFRQILSTIKTASSVTEDTYGNLNYNDAGNVIVFIPSGLAYFNSGNSNIGAYAPIAFQIKLFALKERNHDYDGVPSKYEDFSYDNDGNVFHNIPDGNYFNDDTDGDKIPDFLDNEDDGDGFLTKYEVRFGITSGTAPNEVTTYYYYPFIGAAIDDPATPYDDRRGIPRKFTGPLNPTLPSALESDYTDTVRLRRHLDKTCKPPYQD